MGKALSSKPKLRLTYWRAAMGMLLLMTGCHRRTQLLRERKLAQTAAEASLSSILVNWGWFNKRWWGMRL
jgi:hypothetical protein